MFGSVARFAEKLQIGGRAAPSSRDGLYVINFQLITLCLAICASALVAAKHLLKVGGGCFPAVLLLSRSPTNVGSPSDQLVSFWIFLKPLRNYAPNLIAVLFAPSALVLAIFFWVVGSPLRCALARASSHAAAFVAVTRFVSGLRAFLKALGAISVDHTSRRHVSLWAGVAREIERESSLLRLFARNGFHTAENTRFSGGMQTLLSHIGV